MKYLLFFSLLVLSGCSTSFGRFFQTKVPTPIVKQEAQMEAERRSADFIARTIETPVELKPIAEALSQSLGAPKVQIKSLTLADLPAAYLTASRELHAGQVAQQQQIAELNKQLAKYQGKEIEGTGVNLLGPGIITILVILAVLGVMFPPIASLLFFSLRRVKAAASTVVQGLEEAAQSPETQALVTSIKSRISKKMGDHKMNTASLKNVILDLKKS